MPIPKSKAVNLFKPKPLLKEDKPVVVPSAWQDKPHLKEVIKGADEVVIANDVGLKNYMVQSEVAAMEASEPTVTQKVLDKIAAQVQTLEEPDTSVPMVSINSELVAVGGVHNLTTVSIDGGVPVGQTLVYQGSSTHTMGSAHPNTQQMPKQSTVDLGNPNQKTVVSKDGSVFYVVALGLHGCRLSVRVFRDAIAGVPHYGFRVRLGDFKDGMTQDEANAFFATLGDIKWQGGGPATMHRSLTGSLVLGYMEETIPNVAAALMHQAPFQKLYTAIIALFPTFTYWYSKEAFEGLMANELLKVIQEAEPQPDVPPELMMSLGNQYIIKTVSMPELKDPDPKLLELSVAHMFAPGGPMA